jgi:hypothetical protein
LIYNRNDSIPQNNAYVWFILSTAETVAIADGVMKKKSVAILTDVLLRLSKESISKTRKEQRICPNTTQQWLSVGNSSCGFNPKI